MKAIVVVDNKWGIGKNNDLLFKLPKDLAMYKSKTMGNVCVMGANTYESLPKVALKGRINVVLDHLARVHENAQKHRQGDEAKQAEFDKRVPFCVKVLPEARGVPQGAFQVDFDFVRGQGLFFHRFVAFLWGRLGKV